MLVALRQLYTRYLGAPQAGGFLVVLLSMSAIVWLFGAMLAPLIIAAILAYLLSNITEYTEAKGLPRIAAVSLVCLVTLGLSVVGLFGLIPLLSQQLRSFVREMPSLVLSLQTTFLNLPERYPAVFNEQQIAQLLLDAQHAATEFGQSLVSNTLSALPSILTLAVYVVLVPLLVFFFLKDREQVLSWFKSFAPQNRAIALGIWQEVDIQIGNYIRGKTWEIIIVWIVTYVGFLWLDVRYSLLLSLFVGLSVLIPYVGATIMTIPVAFVAYTQYGFMGDFWWVLFTYLIIQALDGNVLVPILFSEVVNLHPIVIISAVLFFGGVWGITGVFFAIPLATLVRAIGRNWPQTEVISQEEI